MISFSFVAWLLFFPFFLFIVGTVNPLISDSNGVCSLVIIMSTSSVNSSFDSSIWPRPFPIFSLFGSDLLILFYSYGVCTRWPFSGHMHISSHDSSVVKLILGENRLAQLDLR